MADKERIIEFVFRVKTNAYQDELDDLMALGQSLNHHELEDVGEDRDELIVEYIPTGSHWRDVTPLPAGVEGWAVSHSEGSRSALYLLHTWMDKTASYDPAAADLPGGNRLSP